MSPASKGPVAFQSSRVGAARRRPFLLLFRATACGLPLSGQPKQADVTVRATDTVFVEMAWTLSRAHARDRADIRRALRALASYASVVLESPTAVRAATDAVERGPADFARCLPGIKAQAAGCDQLATFDRGI